MTILSPQQLAQVYYNAGFRGNDLTTMTAISLAESGGNTNIWGNGALGISQIQVGAHSAQFNAEYPASVLTNPQTNADAAYTLYKDAGNTFTDWTTFTGGEYRNFLGQAQAGVAALGSSASQSAAPNAAATPTTGGANAANSSSTGNQYQTVASSTPNPFATLFGTTVGNDVTNVGIGIGAFVVALVLIALGMYAIFHRQINAAISRAREGAEMAAVMA